MSAEVSKLAFGGGKPQESGSDLVVAAIVTINFILKHSLVVQSSFPSPDI